MVRPLKTTSSKTILQYIPDFLDYYRENLYSAKTQENYKRFLNKFIFWLKENNLENLKPNELTSTHVLKYKDYLAQCKHQKLDKKIKPITQNYYLIALRALLGYFEGIDVVSLPTHKITLLKADKARISSKILTEDEINQLLSAPKSQDKIGLRDKAIIALLIYSGLKLNQLVKLNRNDCGGISIMALPFINAYLKTRADSNAALFINYRSRKDADMRLTPRSIERIVVKHTARCGFNFGLTPEMLRWAEIRALFNKDILMGSPQSHRLLKGRDYLNTKTAFRANSAVKREKVSTWQSVEKIINNEIFWLKENNLTIGEGYNQNPPFVKCDDCILRKIATLIVSGQITASWIQPLEKNDVLWGKSAKTKIVQKLGHHGQEWHRKMMDIVAEYFKEHDYKVAVEPTLNFGRADLGVYLEKKNPIYIEIGTVSLFKLWYNFCTMPNSNFLVIPEENKILEFKT